MKTKGNIIMNDKLSICKTAIALVVLSPLAMVDMSYAASRVFSDNFESGTTDAWGNYGTFPKCIAVTSAADGEPPKNGAYMMRCGWRGDSHDFDHVELSSWPYNNEFFLRYWVRYDQNMDHLVGAKMMRLGFDGPDNTYWGFQFEYESAPLYMYWEADGAPLGVFWGSEDALAGDHQWHKIEVYIKHDTNNSDGIVRVWVDDSKVWEVVNANTHTSGAHWYPLDLPSNWTKDGTQPDNSNYIYFDNVEIFSDQGAGVSGLMSDGTIGENNTDTLSPPTNLHRVD